MRRFVRLTNAFSKKVEDLGHAVALHFVYYKFLPRAHDARHDHQLSIEELIGLLEEREVLDCLAILFS